MALVDYEVEKELTEKFGTWLDEGTSNANETPVRFMSPRKSIWMGIAASIALILGFYFVFNNEAEQVTRDQLVIDYYTLPGAAGQHNGAMVTNSGPKVLSPMPGRTTREPYRLGKKLKIQAQRFGTIWRIRISTWLITTKPFPF